MNEMDFENRIVSTEFSEADTDIENSLRPKELTDYIGQEKAKENLSVYIQAARGRGEALDHVLLYGPPGLGKTTLAGIIANEMGVNIRITSGPAIEKQGDLAALLTNLQEGDVLFIDEIHRLNRSVEEVLYPAMEDRALDIIIGKGPSARSIRLDLPNFTLVGATTRAGQLSAPLRDRFGVILRLELYTNNELASIVKRSAGILGINIDERGAYQIASRNIISRHIFLPGGVPPSHFFRLVLRPLAFQSVSEYLWQHLWMDGWKSELSDPLGLLQILNGSRQPILSTPPLPAFSKFRGGFISPPLLKTNIHISIHIIKKYFHYFS